MNKYYTPSIEEFHVGFECETTNDGKNWFKIKFESHNFIALEEELLNGMYRVKYLDKEDVENLGFLKAANNWWHKSNIGDDWQILKDDYVYQISYGQHEFSKVYYQGKIKNKSELKVLMKMLNIK